MCVRTRQEKARESHGHSRKKLRTFGEVCRHLAMHMDLSSPILLWHHVKTCSALPLTDSDARLE